MGDKQIPVRKLGKAVRSDLGESDRHNTEISNLGTQEAVPGCAVERGTRMLVQTQEQRMAAKPDPQMILANTLLNMSCLELVQAVQQEVSDNPALEYEDNVCSDCFDPVDASVKSDEAFDGLGCSVFAYRNVGRRSGDEDNPVDPVALAEQKVTLREHLEWQVGIVVKQEDREIADYIISNIDDRGYLCCSTEEVASVCGTTVQNAERVLKAVQSLDPPGVGARDLRECLLIQLDSLAADKVDTTLPTRMVRDFWNELINRRFGPIARRIGVPLDSVIDAFEFIRKNLCPYPGVSFRPSWERNKHKEIPSVKPDVVVYKDRNGELKVELVEHEGTSVRLSSTYLDLWREVQKKPKAFSEAEKRHMSEALARAHMFIRGLEQRRELLRKIAECIVDEQKPFFLSESPEDLRPLTQCRLAALLQVHESTISRGVADKYIQLPSGQVVSFRFFFGKALSAKHMVKMIVQQEDPTAPYSDQQISEILKKLGYSVARRTVLKYREEMNILSSRQRIDRFNRANQIAPQS